jgi:hypothetical protein
MLAELQAPLALVAHDAGAANHLLAWLNAGDLGEGAILPCLDGPALTLWQRSGQRHSLLGLDETLKEGATLLSGTGWASDLEHEARRQARERGIPTIAVIDHWTNYRERFVRYGEVVLPDQVWVTDPHAAELARELLPGVPVQLQPNRYLQAQVAEVQALQAPPAPGPRVLYVLEPIRDAWGELPQPGELSALDFFAEHLAALDLDAATPIRLRPHPSDPPGKYDAWLARHRHRHLDVALDDSPSLAAGLAWADTVAGCQTYAMVVALAAGRRVVSTVPPWAPPCVLPHPEIIRLSALTKQVSL